MILPEKSNDFFKSFSQLRATRGPSLAQQQHKQKLAQREIRKKKASKRKVYAE